MSDVYDATYLADQGFKVFPVREGAKAPPLVANWPTLATTDLDVVQGWWKQWPDANVGIHCDGLVVVDVDPKNDGPNSFAFLEMTDGFPGTYTVATPSGGWHHYFRSPHPAGNTVGLLGKGLDIRSTGGYVLAAGSVLAGVGEYRVANDERAPVADAPQWLLDRLGQAVPKDKSATANIADAAPEVVARAHSWLAGQEGAVEGQGGDARTFTVACGLRDMGVSAMQAYGLLQDGWNGRCAPPWDLDDLWAKVDNAYRYAENPPGVKAVSTDDLPTAIPAPSVPLAESKLRTVEDARLVDLRASNYLVKGWIDRGADCLLFGQWNAGKTFVALDMLACLVLGLPWFGARTRASRALYLAYEGHPGMVKRLRALHGKYPALAGAAFAWWPMRHPLTGDKGRAEMEAARHDFAIRFGAAPDIVVIDPLRNALGGSDSDADLVERLGSEVRALMAADGCAVMKITHSGHGDKSRVRGDSGMAAAADSEILVEAESGSTAGVIRATKQRDTVKSELNFHLDVIQLGIDQDDDPITSCTVIEAQMVVATKLERITGNARRGFDCLATLKPDNSPATHGEWKDACAEFLGGRNVAQRFYDIKKGLLRKGYVVESEDGMVTRRME